MLQVNFQILVLRAEIGEIRVIVNSPINGKQHQKGTQSAAIYHKKELNFDQERYGIYPEMNGEMAQII